MTGSQRIVVVGAGLAGARAAAALRSAGHDGPLVVIGREPHRPYDRPPLSKQVLTGEWAADRTALAVDAADVDWCLGTSVTGLDVAARRLTLAGGEVLTYDGLVLAPGATPRRTPLCELDGVHVLRTLDDALALRADLVRGPRRVLVVGAGFIGAEVASSARVLGLDVVVVEPAAAPMERAVGPVVGAALADGMRGHGVDLRLGSGVCDWTADGSGRIAAVTLPDGSTMDVDAAVVAIGVVPDLGFLTGSGLDVRDGIACAADGSAAPGVVAAGDAARWPNPWFREFRRVEHWDTAARQAEIAAHTLLGRPAPGFDGGMLPWFWSDQFGRKVQLYGSTAGHEAALICDDAAGDGTFVALYRRGEHLVAALSVGRARTLLQFRRLLESGPVPWQTALAARPDAA